MRCSNRLEGPATRDRVTIAARSHRDRTPTEQYRTEGHPTIHAGANMNLTSALLPAVFAAAALSAAYASTTPKTVAQLWYAQPARDWMTEALPMGNGSLGAMVFGGTDWERLQFNEQSLWTGDEKDTGSYQAFGDVIIRLNHGSATTYRRELDIEHAEHHVSYRRGGATYRRTTFVSHPAKVLVLQLAGSKGASQSGTVWLTDMHGATIAASGTDLVSRGSLPNGLRYEAQLRIAHHGGTVHVVSGAAGPTAGGGPLPDVAITFNGCDTVTLYLAASTNYAPDHTRHWRGDDPHARLARAIEAASAKGFTVLETEHIRDYQSLFHRVSIHLGSTPAATASLPTDERLKRYADGNPDPGLEELYFQYGRYLLISSSRPGGLPANLQGLWNDSNTPPWRCDYHSNINVEMNYWPSEIANLAECHLPFLDFIAAQRPVYARNMAEKFPNHRGWTLATESNIFGSSDWEWNIPANAWYCHHLWEHYDFSRDKAYLRKLAYPILKETCEFWEDHLVTLPDGSLATPDGWSPEWGPREAGVTYDQELVWDLFTHYVEAADVLGVDRAYRDRITAMREKLVKPRIGSHGQLKEWMEDRDDLTNHYRHVSHLWAVYPGSQISPDTTPELTEAAKVSLRGRGDESTGWSKAWKINYWARFRDGDHAYNLLRLLLRLVGVKGTNYEAGGGTYPNMLDAHPPFQIDGNLGGTAGFCEMLVQSHTGAIRLLPALPAAWQEGSVTGLRARGSFEIGISWRSGNLHTATVTAKRDATCLLRYGTTTTTLHLRKGETVQLDGKLKRIR